MAVEQLNRFSDGVSVEQLISHVVGSDTLAAEQAGAQVDLAPVDAAFQKLLQSKQRRSHWDAELVEPLHSSLKHIPRSLQLDPMLWEYLAAERFRDLVWERWWDGNPPKDLADAHLVPPSKWRRFECRRTMNGMSRNAISRLFWAGDLLADGADYTLAREMFAKQETQQQVFDRLFGLHGAAARAFVRSSQGRTGTEIQRLGARLNEYGTTIAIEFLDEKDVETLLV